MAKYVRNYLLLMAVATLGVIGYNVWLVENQLPMLEYSAFLTKLENDEIQTARIQGQEITGTDSYGQSFSTYAPDVQQLLPRLEGKNVRISAGKPRAVSPFWSSTFPVVLLMGGWMFFMFRSQKGGSGGVSGGFGKKKIAMDPDKARRVTFADVAGIPEAKEELVEIVEFLKDSKKITRLGGKIPKGVLLQGPPGTGKTLLAKAIAGEAGVPFYSISGSDFVEMFVGVGASRVRDLFAQAKKSAPCIIFIDEIDAVGRSRGAAGAMGGQDEREQTLNALLVEMDGFQSEQTVIIVAATNRPDVLDPALMRPGRFDRQVTIMPPDVKGRRKILEVHSRNVMMDPDVDLQVVAQSTPGFTGAELANLINESALMAARKGKAGIQLSDIEDAKDKILMGAERTGLVISDQQRKVTAYHEAGHAILAKVLPNTDPVHKITIIPRGQAMGVMQQVPIDDRHAYSKEYLTNRIKILLGGRTAEEIVFNEFSTGASNDLQVATDIATRMVCEWGMSERLGPRAFVTSDQGFLGSGSRQRAYSEEIARTIDEEVSRIIAECYQEAIIVLEGRITFLHKLAEVLLLNETIDAEEVDIIVTCPKLTEENKEKTGLFG
ncbi:ATP-dependent zinc metalloprotease FtsH [Desulfovibrionaceae bacterium CB1MN]|uniref:ATP-dependent zinc metalloprotease FtsH n=1 Tax=Hydrosulfovibrio ferrireducens TaxID=2934181 RepID=UPI003ABB6CD4